MQSFLARSISKIEMGKVLLKRRYQDFIFDLFFVFLSGLDLILALYLISIEMSSGSGLNIQGDKVEKQRDKAF